MTTFEIPQQKQAKIFGIYDPTTGLWSRGGTGPKWSKTHPKTWTLGPLKNHLAQFVDSFYTDRKIIIKPEYKNSVIVDMSTGKEATEINLYEYLHQKAKADKEYRERYSKNNIEIVEK